MFQTNPLNWRDFLVWGGGELRKNRQFPLGGLRPRDDRPSYTVGKGLKKRPVSNVGEILKKDVFGLQAYKPS
jgi:hypothetical protein